MSITVKQIQLLLADLGVELPVAPNGSGKNGRIVKVDLLRTLVQNVFNDMAPERQEEIINALLGKGKKGADGEDPEHVLKLVSKMDPREAPQFEKMVRHAVDELAARAVKAKQKSKPQPAEAEAGEKPAQSVEEQAVPGPAAERPPPAPAARAPIGRAKAHAPPEIVALLPQWTICISSGFLPNEMLQSISSVSQLSKAQGFGHTHTHTPALHCARAHTHRYVYIYIYT